VAARSNDDSSGSESGDADDGEPAEPSSPAGRAASHASSDGMDAEARAASRHACHRSAGLDCVHAQRPAPQGLADLAVGRDTRDCVPDMSGGAAGRASSGGGNAEARRARWR